MKVFLIASLLCLTSICEATSTDGGTVYVDKDGWVIGAAQPVHQTNNLFNDNKKSSPLLDKVIQKDNEGNFFKFKFKNKR